MTNVVELAEQFRDVSAQFCKLIEQGAFWFSFATSRLKSGFGGEPDPED